MSASSDQGKGKGKAKGGKGGKGKSAAKPEPEYWKEREDLFKKLFEEQESAKKAVDAETAAEIEISLPDGSIMKGKAGVTSGVDVAKHTGEIADALVIKVNGEKLQDLSVPLEESCSAEIVKFDTAEGQKVFWHSSAHILGQALEKHYAGQLCIGPPIEEGFYYDIALKEDQAVSSDDFDDIKRLVNGVIKSKQPFQRLVLKKEDALEMFKYNKYKVQLINEKVPDGEVCTAYRCGPLIDLCKGPHVSSTSRIQAMTVTKNSSCYWKGDNKNDTLHRVFGVSFPKKEQLSEWVERKEQEALRDHRRIGTQQELFFFDPTLSVGSPFFLPHGTRIYNRLMEFIRSEYRNRGFDEVITPNVFSNKLYETSGHAGHYAKNMFHFTAEDETFAMKPMNCPGHCVIFGHRNRSWRELPLRMADFGVLHRNELSGSLGGLTRVRRFCQDDAHIFCRPDQIQAEIANCFEFMTRVYGIFGFAFELELSTRPDEYLGELEVWNRAEAVLQEELEKTGMKWVLNPGDGAFYGPKIDVHIRDAIGRSHQCATIQLDFQLPQKFELKYAGEKGQEQETPVIIHRAIYGSFERFFAILIEHTAGKWPLWVSPRQIMVVPIGKFAYDYAQKVQQIFHEAGFYVDCDLSGKKLEKKVRDAQVAQYNFQFVVGKTEAQNNSVNIRARDNTQVGEKSIDETLAYLQQLVKEFQ